MGAWILHPRLIPVGSCGPLVQPGRNRLTKQPQQLPVGVRGSAGGNGADLNVAKRCLGFLWRPPFSRDGSGGVVPTRN